MPLSPTEPEEIDIESPTSPLVIRWEDGHRSVYALEYLRRMCPCAECTDHGQTPLTVRMIRRMHAKAFEVKSVEEVGRYALRVTWKDAHDAGLYSFTHLREICPCHTCRQVDAEYDV
jgi:DUF971 family protein